MTTVQADQFVTTLTKTLTADCGTAGVALGGGAIVWGQNGDLTGTKCHLVWSGPVDGNPTQWRAEGQCDPASSGVWELMVQAVCGRVSP